MARPAIPPTTPPAMAPVLDDFFFEPPLEALDVPVAPLTTVCVESPFTRTATVFVTSGAEATLFVDQAVEVVVSVTVVAACTVVVIVKVVVARRSIATPRRLSTFARALRLGSGRMLNGRGSRIFKPSGAPVGAGKSVMYRLPACNVPVAVPKSLGRAVPVYVTYTVVVEPAILPTVVTPEAVTVSVSVMVVHLVVVIVTVALSSKLC